MNCPACKDPMIVLDYNSVEIDYCVSCQGIWLDAGEIELLFGDAEACGRFIRGGNPALARGEKPRRCPQCGKKMAKAVTGGARPIVYDRCGRGDGLWFDKGELAAILAQGNPPEDSQPVTDFLREVFSGGSGS